MRGWCKDVSGCEAGGDAAEQTVLVVGGFVDHAKNLNLIFKATGYLCKIFSRK